MTSLEIDFEIPPLRKNEPVEKMVLHAPQMWSVECYDTELESGHNKLERVDRCQDAFFPSDWDEIVLRLAPWEISTILGFVNECKDTFDAHSRLKNVKTSVKRFPLEHMEVIRENPKMRGYYSELKLQGPKDYLKSARDAILNCVCRSNFRKPLMEKKKSQELTKMKSSGSFLLKSKKRKKNISGGGMASMFAKKIGNIRYKHPAFNKLKRFGLGVKENGSTKLEEEEEDENLRVLNCIHELSEQKALNSDPSFMIGTSWIVFGETKTNRGLLTFRPTVVSMVCRYVDDEGDVTEHYSVRAMERQRHVRRRKAEYFSNTINREYLAEFDKKYSTNLSALDTQMKREQVVIAKSMSTKLIERMGDDKLLIETLTSDFEWFPVESVSTFIQSEWIIEGEYRDDDGSIELVRLRKLVIKRKHERKGSALFAIWTKHGIQVFNSGSDQSFEIRTLRTPSLVYQLQDFMQNDGRELDVVRTKDKNVEKDLHPPPLDLRKSNTKSRPHRELKYALQHLNVNDKSKSYARTYVVV